MGVTQLRVPYVIMPKSQTTPLQAHMQWTEYVHREVKDQAKENVRGKQYMTFLESQQIQDGQLSYYNNAVSAGQRHGHMSGYDRLFHANTDYEKKLHRDDRAAKLNLDVRSEEEQKPIPCLSSSVYGRGAPLETVMREHVRIESVYKGFYRSRGTGIPFGGNDKFSFLEN